MADDHPEPEELVNIPDFIKELQTKYTHPKNTGPPDKKEIKSTLCALKNGKSSSDIPAEFLKYASVSDNLLLNSNDLWSTKYGYPTLFHVLGTFKTDRIMERSIKRKCRRPIDLPRPSGWIDALQNHGNHNPQSTIRLV